MLRELLADAMETSAELSDLARGLHPAVLTERGLAAALQALTARCRVPVNLSELPGRRYADFVETTAYLIADEALTNVAAHSHATECTLLAADRGDRLDLEIRDNGIGGATAAPGRRARVLADRAAAIGAASRSSRRAATAPTVRVEIPVERVSDWRYSFRDRIRYGDLDTNAHLNNVAVPPVLRERAGGVHGRVVPGGRARSAARAASG